jgi:hypothetical protein
MNKIKSYGCISHIRETKMEKRPLSSWSVIVGIVIVLILSGCNMTTPVEELKTEIQLIELGSADSTNVKVGFGAGVLHVAGGGANLMDATFRYNVAEWQPDVNYSEDGDQGTLTLNQHGERLPIGGKVVNEWDLQFNNDVPLELLIQAGAGKSQLDLASLNLTAVTIETGAGTTDIDLNGDWQHDLHVSVSGGVGEITVNLPAAMGVHVKADTALVSVNTTGLTKVDGGYVNDAYETAPYTLTLDVESGVGAVTFVVIN